MENDAFWRDPFSVLASLRNQLGRTKSGVLMQNKQRFHDSLIQAIDSSNDGLKLLAGEVLAEVVKSWGDGDLRPMARLLQKLMATQTIIDTKVTSFKIVR